MRLLGCDYVECCIMLWSCFDYAQHDLYDNSLTRRVAHPLGWVSRDKIQVGLPNPPQAVGHPKVNDNVFKKLR